MNHITENATTIYHDIKFFFLPNSAPSLNKDVTADKAPEQAAHVNGVCPMRVLFKFTTPSNQ